MDGKAIHRCLHVLDLEKSIAFYEKALGMTEIRRMGPEDGSWTNVFMGNATSGFQLELTWNRGRTEPYDNGGGLRRARRKRRPRLASGLHRGRLRGRPRIA